MSETAEGEKYRAPTGACHGTVTPCSCTVTPQLVAAEAEEGLGAGKDSHFEEAALHEVPRGLCMVSWERRGRGRRGGAGGQRGRVLAAPGAGKGRGKRKRKFGENSSSSDCPCPWPCAGTSAVEQHHQQQDRWAESAAAARAQQQTYL